MDACQIKFDDYKDKVAQAYPQLDLSKIVAIKRELKGGEEKEIVEEEVTDTEESTTEDLGVEATITKAPEELTINSEAWT